MATKKRPKRRGSTARSMAAQARELRKKYEAARDALIEAQERLESLEGPEGALSPEAFKAALQANDTDLEALDEIIAGAVMVQTDEGPMLKPARNSRARVEALRLKWAYAYGNPPQPLQHEGGDRPIQVEIVEVEEDED